MYKINDKGITSVQKYIQIVTDAVHEWKIQSPPWFRGQKVKKNKTKKQFLLPTLYKEEKYLNRENELVQVFRMRAQNYGDVPEFSRIDQWLFLMQHCGLPTRLLDWTEGSLIALFFAIYDYNEEIDKDVNVWLINPMVLNILSCQEFGFGLTWRGYKADEPITLGSINAAFENDAPHCGQPKYPVAIYPQPVHPRVIAQKGCFTIHGKDKNSIEHIFNNVDIECIISQYDLEIVMQSAKRIWPNCNDNLLTNMIDDFIDGKYLQKISVKIEDLQKWYFDLRSLGISYSTLFPEFDGLAKELKSMKTYQF